MDQEENNNAEEIRRKFSALPPEIKNLAYSSEMMEIIKQVAEKNQLHIDKIELLEGEAVDVMTGFTMPRDFVKSLMDNLEVDQTKAEAIAKDINEMLLSKIRESMKKIDLPVDNIPTPSNPPAMNTPVFAPIHKLEDKSVVMPSAAKSVSEPVTPIVATPARPLATPATEINPPAKPPELPVMDHIDTMLSQPTVSVAPNAPVAAPASPAPSAGTEAPATKAAPIYKSDPYHEPID